MSTVVKFDGVAADCPRPVLPRRLDLYRARGGTPSFTFEVRDGAPPADPDPYLGKECSVEVGGTLRFKGDVVSRECDPPGSGRGWVKRYSAVGLRDRGDRIPHTDGNDGSDQSSYNMKADTHSFEYRADRDGRAFGEIIRDALESPENAAALDARGLGNYVTLTPPTLPASTLADLAALTHRPPGGLTFGGERLLTAVDGAAQTWAPNHRFDVDPDGTFRFRDQRLFTDTLLTLGTDPIDPTPLRRDLTPCYGRVVVKGQPVAEVAQARLSLGHLTEAPFAHSGLTVAQAKAAWRVSDFTRQDAQDEGTCVCLSTTTVRLTSADAARFWAANFWDATSTGRRGALHLIDQAGATIAMFATRNVVSNAALTAGGTCDVVVDLPLPHLDFDHYELRGLAGNAANVWRTYGLPAWLGAKAAKQTSVPYAFKLANGQAATMTTQPMGSVMWSGSGTPPYQEVAYPVSVDPGAGTVAFSTPTWITAGNRPPSEVRAFVPYYSGLNTLVHPPDVSGAPQYEGTAHSVEGWAETLTVTSRGWRDPANRAQIQAYAEDLLDSVKDAVVEGVVVYKGLFSAALAPGLALSVGGDDNLAWASAALPVQECQLEWVTGPREGLTHRTVMRCSNRRAALTDAAYLLPDRTGLVFGSGRDGPGLAAPPPAFGGGPAQAPASGPYRPAGGLPSAPFAGRPAPPPGGGAEKRAKGGPEKTPAPPSLKFDPAEEGRKQAVRARDAEARRNETPAQARERRRKGRRP